MMIIASLIFASFVDIFLPVETVWKVASRPSQSQQVIQMRFIIKWYSPLLNVFFIHRVFSDTSIKGPVVDFQFHSNLLLSCSLCPSPLSLNHFATRWTSSLWTLPESYSAAPLLFFSRHRYVRNLWHNVGVIKCALAHFITSAVHLLSCCTCTAASQSELDASAWLTGGNVYQTNRF